MGFSIKSTQFDLGQTQIENMFIHDFMPMASGTFIKVYLMGYYFASSQLASIDHKALADHLKLPMSDVIDAWYFWEKKKIVKLHSVDNADPYNFDVEFLSIRELYITNNFKTKTQMSSGVQTSDRLFSAMSNPQIKQLLTDVQLMVRRPLDAKETTRILDFHSVSKMDLDVIYRAFYIAFEEKKIRKTPFKYVEGIIKNWYDMRIFTMPELVAYENQHDERFAFYRQIMSVMGYKDMLIKDDMRSVINACIDDKKFSESYILEVITELAKRTPKITAAYLEAIFDDLAERGIKCIELAKQHFKTKKNVPKYKTKTKNGSRQFSQNTLSSMSEDEIEAIIKKQNSIG